MRTNTFIQPIGALFAVCAMLTVLCAPDTLVHAEEDATLEIGVTSNGETSVRQVAGWPIVLQVTLANPDAMNALLDNIAKEHQKNSPTPDKVPGIPVGSESKPLASLIRFTAVSGRGKSEHPVAARLLLSAFHEAPKATTLDGRTAFRAQFGIEPKDLGSKPGESIVISATVTEKIPGVATVVSKPLRIELVAETRLGPLARIQAQYLAGEYYVFSQQYKKAAPWAERLDKMPQLAAVLRAEMYLGLGETTKAREACRQAIALYATNSQGDPETEPPIYLFELLKRIEQTRQ